ncbi:MAG: STAS domain-containing protein [Verrucomicrobiota bacterium]|nr:STAS domain-containing protein [Verrucomicrobiota bacterium]
MRLIESRHGQVHVFHLQGAADSYSASALRGLFSAKADRQCLALVADFSGVTFIDSKAIAVLLEYLRDSKAYEGAFCIAGLKGRVCDIFEIIRLDRVVPLFPTVAQAVAALSDKSLPVCPAQLFGAAPQRTLAATA